jgi:hypothetical protein
MTNLARQRAEQGIYQEYARVIEVQGRQCRVRTQEGVYAARQAVSCLLTPEIGDQVLVAVSDADDAYVLAILAREGQTSHRIELQREVQLRVRQGRLKVTSQEGLDLASARDIRTMSEEVNINAVKGRFSIHDGLFQGGFLRARIGTIKWLADSVESMVARLTQRVKRLYRTVDEFEQVRAGRVDYLVEKLLSFRSRYTVLSSKEDVKVDGERIHIG